LTFENNSLLSKIGGSIIASKNPSESIKNWRNRLSIKQMDLARVLNVSPSVLSDYESGRRASPGINFVRKYIEALIKLDGERENFLGKLVSDKDTAIIDIGEFYEPISANRIVKLVKGKILSGKELLKKLVYGYTVLDSIKTIYSLSGFDFYQIFGANTDRILVFTKVGLGRSPIVAIRVSQFKPVMVILHGPTNVDKLAIDLAKKEKIILILSFLPKEEDFSCIFKEL
jgi:putative transcriptional regulator